MSQHSVRIPADVDREDTLVAGLTARQVAVMALTGLVLYGGWMVTRTFLPVIAYLIIAVPIGASVAVLVVLRRDGVTLDRLLAVLRQRLQPQRRVAAGHAPATVPEWLAGVTDESGEPVADALELPASGVDEAGVVDLGSDGLALIAACSTVNFSLRTPAEQQALTAAFGRYLHSLFAPVQILVRAQRLDLSGQIGQLRERAASLPHAALETAALDHADYLERLGDQTELLRRQILLVLREPVRSSTQHTLARRHGRQPEPTDGTRRAAASRLLRRMHEASELLSPAGIEITPLDAAQATAVLTAATNPDSPLPPSPERWPAPTRSSPPRPARTATPRKESCDREDDREELSKRTRDERVRPGCDRGAPAPSADRRRVGGQLRRYRLPQRSPPGVAATPADPPGSARRVGLHRTDRSAGGRRTTEKTTRTAGIQPATHRLPRTPARSQGGGGHRRRPRPLRPTRPW
nr:PrgI family protein [Actinopolyspora mortivallis]